MEIFKRVQKLGLIILLGLFLNTMAYGYGIKGNNSFANAYNIGYWQYHGSLVTELPKFNEKKERNAAYYTFYANKGDRIYISAAVASYNDMKIELFRTSDTRNPIATGVVYHREPNYYGSRPSAPFLFVNAEAKRNGETFFIKVSQSNNTIVDLDTLYFSIAINNRISQGSSIFKFSGVAVNPGNKSFNPNGVDSSVISMDLRDNSNIPDGAIIKSITTDGRVSGNVRISLHKLKSSQYSDRWYDSIVGGHFNISSKDELNVKEIWYFKYNFKGTLATTMSDVEASISYEYDRTIDFLK